VGIMTRQADRVQNSAHGSVIEAHCRPGGSEPNLNRFAVGPQGCNDEHQRRVPRLRLEKGAPGK
jgi:hypothetical protein